MRIKTVRKKGKRVLSENGKPLPYSKLAKPEKSIRSIRGIFKAWSKAKKFGLQLEAQEIRMYLSRDETLTPDRKQAMPFAKGFDGEEAKRLYWQARLNLKFKIIDL